MDAASRRRRVGGWPAASPAAHVTAHMDGFAAPVTGRLRCAHDGNAQRPAHGGSASSRRRQRHVQAQRVWNGKPELRAGAKMCVASERRRDEAEGVVVNEAVDWVSAPARWACRSREPRARI